MKSFRASLILLISVVRAFDALLSKVNRQCGVIMIIFFFRLIFFCFCSAEGEANAEMSISTSSFILKY